MIKPKSEKAIMFLEFLKVNHAFNDWVMCKGENYVDWLDTHPKPQQFITGAFSWPTTEVKFWTNLDDKWLKALIK